MPLFDNERVRELRQEIAELRKAILVSRGRKGYEADRQRMQQLERLEEIRAQLKFLVERNKTVN